MGEAVLRNILEPRFPDLLDEMRQLVSESEREFNAAAGRPGSGFLWEHTVLVAVIAARLAEAAGDELLLPVVAALFHDTGKFQDGVYHDKEIAEEEFAVRLVRRMMPRRGMTAVETETVALSLRALYCEDQRQGPLTDLLHDADFLSKFGCLGVAAFFTKAALRQLPMREAVTRWLSKELTYARAAERTLRTSAGRAQAAAKSLRAEDFFGNLLAEMRQLGMARFKLETRRVAEIAGMDGPPLHPDTEIVLVLPEACEVCGAAPDVQLSLEEGIKCRKLVARVGCAAGHDIHEMVFCLPEIAS
jgi:hypothetical protein